MKTFIFHKEPMTGKSHCGRLARAVIVMVLAIVATMPIVSCSSEDGDWDTMIWRSETPVVKTGDNSYDVKAEGGTYIFTCSNYSAPWFADANEDGETIWPPINNSEYTTIEGEQFEASIHGKELHITFRPNATSQSRRVSITVTSGDIFCTFSFRQFGSSRPNNTNNQAS